MENQIIEKSYGIFSTAANRKIINDLENKGAKVFQFPVTETEIIDNWEIIDFIKNELSAVDWLIFADIFTVDYFIELLEKSGNDLFELDEKRILVFGEAIADKLRFSQIHADVIPNSIRTVDIFLKLIEYLQTDNFVGIKFFMPISSDYINDLKKILETKGAEVIEKEIYKLKIENKNEITKLFALLKGGAIDNFIFSAPEDIFYFSRLFNSLNLSEVLSEVNIFATNEITMQTLHENKLNSKYYLSK